MGSEAKLLDGKTVVIIGGAGLIGQTFAEGIVAHGGKVIIADIDITRCQGVCRRISDKVAGIPLEAEMVDMTSKLSLDSLIARISAVHGSIDAVINAAYPHNKNYGRKLDEVEYQDFCENINLHLGGYFLSTQRFASHFKIQGHGQVINISSIYGSVAPRFEIYEGTAMTMPIEYAAIKSALQHISVYFMRYYKGTKLRFNCISPGGIFDNQPESFLLRYKQFAQHKGMLNASDIVGTLIYLLSDLSLFVNGQNLVVDDGWSS
jgi:NAD(P)-dependent dehydrogenase (short-subunit alcohol dehydrogenase family)